MLKTCEKTLQRVLCNVTRHFTVVGMLMPHSKHELAQYASPKNGNNSLVILAMRCVYLEYAWIRGILGNLKLRSTKLIRNMFDLKSRTFLIIHQIEREWYQTESHTLPNAVVASFSVIGYSKLAKHRQTRRKCQYFRFFTTRTPVVLVRRTLRSDNYLEIGD